MSTSKLFFSRITALFGAPVRCYRMLGVRPHEGLSLQQQLEKLSYQDPAIYYKVNIGFPLKTKGRSEEMKERSDYLKAKKKDPEHQRLVLEKKLKVSIEEVHNEWLDRYAASQKRTVADHYGIFEHLFGDAYFYPHVGLDIEFTNKDVKIPVHFGNVVKPEEALSAPSVTYKADPNSLWTLLLTNPDGHLKEENAEYIHWFIGNIPGNDIKKGEIIVDYLQPFPPKGTGYQRLVFVLYKQDKNIDFASYKKPPSSTLNLDDRTFSTYDFYRDHQDFMTPAGLAFFQSDWDHSVSTFFHDDLNSKEPVFEYDFPDWYIKKQKWFPKKESFNLYMDRYRDPKQIAKEYFLRRMKKTHPFRPPKYVLRFPGAYAINKADPNRDPTWLYVEKLKERLKWGRMNDF